MLGAGAVQVGQHGVAKRSWHRGPNQFSAEWRAELGGPVEINRSVQQLAKFLAVLTLNLDNVAEVFARDAGVSAEGPIAPGSHVGLEYEFRPRLPQKCAHLLDYQRRIRCRPTAAS
jgi:hypothetical protein